MPNSLAKIGYERLCVATIFGLAALVFLIILGFSLRFGWTLSAWIALFWALSCQLTSILYGLSAIRLLNTLMIVQACRGDQ